jgi:hypothetical protein
VATTGPAASTPRGPTIDVSNFGGGCYRTCHQHPPGGLPSTSPTSMVAAAGPAASTPQGPTIDVSNFSGGCYRTCRHHPQGPRHQRLQLQWWPLPDLLLAPPRGGRHRRLQLRWWSLPDLSPAPPRGPGIDVSNFSGGRCRTCRRHPPGGPPSTSPILVVGVVGPAASTPQGPAIDVSNFWTSSSGTSWGPDINVS